MKASSQGQNASLWQPSTARAALVAGAHAKGLNFAPSHLCCWASCATYPYLYGASLFTPVVCMRRVAESRVKFLSLDISCIWKSWRSANKSCLGTNGDNDVQERSRHQSKMTRVRARSQSGISSLLSAMVHAIFHPAWRKWKKLFHNPLSCGWLCCRSCGQGHLFKKLKLRTPQKLLKSHGLSFLKGVNSCIQSKHGWLLPHLILSTDQDLLPCSQWCLLYLRDFPAFSAASFKHSRPRWTKKSSFTLKNLNYCSLSNLLKAATSIIFGVLAVWPSPSLLVLLLVCHCQYFALNYLTAVLASFPTKTTAASQRTQIILSSLILRDQERPLPIQTHLLFLQSERDPW